MGNQVRHACSTRPTTPSCSVRPSNLRKTGFKRDGNRWMKRKQVFLPLYEAKMVQAYDHRAASVVVDEATGCGRARPRRRALVEHQNPEFMVEPRWWVDETGGARAPSAREMPGGFLAFKDVTSPTNQRTMIAAVRSRWPAVTNHLPLDSYANVEPRLAVCCLLANLNSFVLDFVARQKVGGVHLNFFIVEQLPTLPPDRYDENVPGTRRQTLEKWISERVLKLTCTATT